MATAYFTRRKRAALDRILSGGPPFFTPDFVLADAVPRHTRRFTNFSGDVSGRYLEALSAEARLGNKPAKGLGALAANIITCQKPDGHFGDEGAVTEKETRMSRFWGNGRLLVGLTEYAALSGDKKVLAAAKKLGDHFVNCAPVMNSEAVWQAHSGLQGAVGYICWTQIIEGLVPLARLTGEKKYLDLAASIAQKHRHHEAQHTHGYLCALRGMVTLALETKDPAPLDQVEAEWDWMHRSGNVLTWGSISEYFAPKESRDEGCSEADWLRLNLELHRATGKDRYLAAAEDSLWNGFAYNQFDTGDFGHHQFGRGGCCGPNARAWWCCTFHGLRALTDLEGRFLHGDEKGFRLDSPISAQATAAGRELICESTLETNGGVRLTVKRTGKDAWDLALRCPPWAHGLGARLGKKKVTLKKEGAFWVLSRVWKKGDVITVQYGMATTIVPHAKEAGTFALRHGPWFLGVCEAQDPAFFDEPHNKNAVVLPKVKAGAEVSLGLAPKQKAGNAWAIPAGHRRIDFLPGGYPSQKQQATLKPIAEQTGYPDHTAWVWWFTTTADSSKDIPAPKQN